ncbi:MAG: response regulator [Syntrophotaleaceae bacterium]
MTLHKRILLAEDDPNDVELTLTVFAEFGLADKLDVVRDGQEALDYLYRRGSWSNRPDGNPVAVLLDLKMPRVDGLEVLRQIKTDPVTRATPVIMLTSSREERDLVKSYCLGVNAYVVKPAGFQDFTKAIREISTFWVLVNEAPDSGQICPE